jgi:hypothetical protein
MHIVTGTGSTNGIVYNNGGPIPECPFTINADGASGTFTCTFPDKTIVNQCCKDVCYFAFHVTPYDYVEARYNLVNMFPTCYSSTAVSLDGTAITIGDAPDDGYMVADFCIGFIAEATVGTGGAYVYICYDHVTEYITVSGTTYGLSSDIDEMYIYCSTDVSTSYLLYVSYYNFPTDCPFSFTVSVTEWDLAKIRSGYTYMTVQTVTNPTGELKVDFDGADFPTTNAACQPRILELPENPLTCEYELSGIDFDDTTCSDVDYYCSIYSYSITDESLTKGCTYANSYCYSCDCTADLSDLPSSGYLCCNTDNCNSGSFSVYNCLFDGSGAGSISYGLLVSIFVVLFMKWFN